jgi:hypothetical protein
MPLWVLGWMRIPSKLTDRHPTSLQMHGWKFIREFCIRVVLYGFGSHIGTAPISGFDAAGNLYIPIGAADNIALSRSSVM